MGVSRGEINEGPGKTEWESGDILEDQHREYTHKPCGARIIILLGFPPVCSRCEPERWDKLYGKKEAKHGTE